jgi:DNA repair and recombination protein RAD52
MNGFGLPTVAVQEPDLANPHQLAPVAIPALNPREFTPTEQIDIAANLKRGLGPEYIANRSGPGGTKVSYIEGISVYQIYLEGWKSLAIANEVFGFNGCHLAFNTNTGWSSQVISSTIDYCDIINGKFNLGVSCIVRVSLKDGSFHEDVGTGSMDNSKSKSQAYDKSYKTAGLRFIYLISSH